MKVHVWASIDEDGSKVTRVIEVANEDLKGYTIGRASRIINDRAWSEVQDMIEWGWRIEGGETEQMEDDR